MRRVAACGSCIARGALLPTGRAWLPGRIYCALAAHDIAIVIMSHLPTHKHFRQQQLSQSHWSWPRYGKFAFFRTRRACRSLNLRSHWFQSVPRLYPDDPDAVFFKFEFIFGDCIPGCAVVTAEP